jgi:hypothetical protein
MSIPLLCAMERRLDALLEAGLRPVSVSWGVWLGYARVGNLALDWDTLFEVWRTKDALLKRAQVHETFSKHAKAHVVLGTIQFCKADGTIQCTSPKCCWILRQTNDGITVKRQTGEDERTLRTVSDWCSFMDHVHPPIHYRISNDAKQVMSIPYLCELMMMAYYSGPMWREIGPIPLHWDRLVGFLSTKDTLVETPNWYSIPEVSHIRTCLLGYTFQPDSGLFSFKRHGASFVWQLACTPDGAFVSATTVPNSKRVELETVQDLREFLWATFPDIYFVSDYKKQLSCRDLTDHLMQRYEWR